MQSVQFKNVFSSGVQQGSLGPPLISLYVNDLQNVLKFSKILV